MPPASSASVSAARISPVLTKKYPPGSDSALMLSSSNHLHRQRKLRVRIARQVLRQPVHVFRNDRIVNHLGRLRITCRASVLPSAISFSIEYQFTPLLDIARADLVGIFLGILRDGRSRSSRTARKGANRMPL